MRGRGVTRDGKGEIERNWLWLILGLWILALLLLFFVIYRNQKETEVENCQSVNRQVVRQINNVMEQIDNLNKYI